jgi:hypothetical protein
LLSLLPVSVCDALPASALATASPPAGKESMATRLSQTVSSPSRYLPASMMGAPLAHEGLPSLGWAESDGADGRKDSARRATRSTTPGPAASTTSKKHPSVVSPRTRSSVHAHRERLIKGRVGSSTPSTEQIGEAWEREGQHASREASLLRSWMHSETKAFDTSLGRAGAWQRYQPGVVATDSAAPFSFRSGMHAISEQGRANAAPSAASKSSYSLKKSPGALENEGSASSYLPCAISLPTPAEPSPSIPPWMARGNGVRPLPHRFSAKVHGHCLLQTRGAVGLSRPPMVPSLDLSILVMQESILRAKEKVLNADLAWQSMRSKIHVLSEEERQLVEFMQQDQRRPGVLNDLQTSAVSAIESTGKELQTSAASAIESGMGPAQQKTRSSPGRPNVVRSENVYPLIDGRGGREAHVRSMDVECASDQRQGTTVGWKKSVLFSESTKRSEEERSTTQLFRLRRQDSSLLSSAELLRLMQFEDSARAAASRPGSRGTSTEGGGSSCRSSVSAHAVEEEIQPERLQACEGARAALGLLSDQNDAGLRKGARARRQTFSASAHAQAEAANVAGTSQLASTHKHEQAVLSREQSVDKQEVEASEAETDVDKDNREWTHYKSARTVCDEACCCPDASRSSTCILSCESTASLYSSPRTFDHHHHVHESPRNQDATTPRYKSDVATAHGYR